MPDLAEGLEHAGDQSIDQHGRPRDVVESIRDAPRVDPGAGPSVMQVRMHHVLPDHPAHFIIATFRQYESALQAGVLLTVDEGDARVRLLPMTGASRE